MLHDAAATETQGAKRSCFSDREPGSSQSGGNARRLLRPTRNVHKNTVLQIMQIYPIASLVCCASVQRVVASEVGSGKADFYRASTDRHGPR